MRKLLFLLLVAGLMFGLSGCGLDWRSYAYPHAYIEKDLKVELEPVDRKYEVDEPILLRFSVTNVGSRPIRVCRWHSPLEGRFTVDYLKVYHKKTPVYYTGPRLKRNAPLMREYVTLNPGEILMQTVDVSQAYVFEKDGKYMVQFEGSPVNHLPDSEEILIKLK